MLFTIRKEFKFEAAHQLRKGCFTQDCSDTIHGHSYKVELFLTSSVLDANEMVIDFGALKPMINKICDQWDHALILGADLFKEYKNLGFELMNRKIISLEKNPTAETMAFNLFYHFQNELKLAKVSPHIKVKSVRVHETATGFSEFSED